MIKPLVPIRSREKATLGLKHLRENQLRVGFIMSGGPAPGVNRVIGSAAKLFNEWEIGCLGFFNGYEYLQRINPPDLRDTLHFRTIAAEDASKFIEQNSSVIYTSRANPGKQIEVPADLLDSEKIKELEKVLDVFESLRIGALVSIGGDDTLKTANFLQQVATRRDTNNSAVFRGVVHVPKTIDNDYYGIPWTFGFFTAAEFAGEIVRGLYDDAKSTHAYHIVELMGRKAGWFTAAASIYGRATKAIIPEDYQGLEAVNFEQLAEELVRLIQFRETKGKKYGVICIAEGMADKLPDEIKSGLPKDRHGNPKLGEAQIGDFLRKLLELKYKELTKKEKKFTYKTVGYETRQRPVNLFDCLLSSQLGFGAFRLISNSQFGQMVSVSDNLQIKSVDFRKLINPQTLKVRNRGINTRGDFYHLLRVLEDWVHEEEFEG